MKESEYAIVAKGLRKSFGSVRVLEGIDLEVKRGSVLALLGPNGAGKTTTVRILSTLLQADAGRATIEGYDIAKQADAVRGVIGLTGQYAAVDEYLTGPENLEMIARLYRVGSEEAKRRSGELIEQFDLSDAAKRPVKTYSGGMRRRLDLAMSLIAEPPVIFLDEPTTGLDPRSRLGMWEIIKRLVKGGTTILLTTQYMDEADQLADRITVIDHGRVIAEGTADTLKSRVGSDRLELTLSARSSLEAAQKALTGEALQVDLDRRSVSLATKNGVATLKQVLQRLEVAKIEVESVSLQRPTLDDVFLALTGHAATIEQSDDTLSKSKKADT